MPLPQNRAHGLSVNRHTRVRPEDVILTACTKPTFGPIDRACVLRTCDSASVDWKLILSAALAHRVAPLVYLHLEQCNGLADSIPGIIREEFLSHTLENRQSKIQRRPVIASVADYFSNVAHDVMLLKGSAMDLRFGKDHSHVMADDVDLAVRPISTTSKSELGKSTWRYIQQIKETINDEAISIDGWCHFNIAFLWCGWFSTKFAEVWDRAVRVKIDGSSVLIPSDSDLLITSSINFVRKNARWRNLFDVCLIIQSAGALNWDEIVARAQSYRCNGILYGALLAAQTHFGCDLDPDVLRDLKVGGPRKWILGAITPAVSPCQSYLAALVVRGTTARPLDKHQPATPATREIPSLVSYWMMLSLFTRTTCDPYMLSLYYVTYPRYWFDRVVELVRKSRFAGPIRHLLSCFGRRSQISQNEPL